MYTWPIKFDELTSKKKDGIKYQISMMAIGDTITINERFDSKDLHEIGKVYGMFFQIRTKKDFSIHKVKRVAEGTKSRKGISLSGVI